MRRETPRQGEDLGMITWQALFGYSLLATVVSSLVWFAFRIAWPRKVEPDQHEMLTSEFERTP